MKAVHATLELKSTETPISAKERIEKLRKKLLEEVMEGQIFFDTNAETLRIKGLDGKHSEDKDRDSRHRENPGDILRVLRRLGCTEIEVLEDEGQGVIES